MNRKAFLTTVAALFTAPFLKEEKPEPKPPTERPVEVADVEKYVNEMIDKRMVITIKGNDLWLLNKNYRHGSRG
jgi:hypothetical protein